MTPEKRAEAVQAVQAMKAKGLTVHPVTPALEEEWRTPIQSRLVVPPAPAVRIEHVPTRAPSDERQGRPARSRNLSDHELLASTRQLRDLRDGRS